MQRVVEREAVGDVSSCAVDEDPNGPAAVVGELAGPLDYSPGAVLIDVTDEVDVAEPVGLFLLEHVLDGVHKVPQQAVADVGHIGGPRTPHAGMEAQPFPGLIRLNGCRLWLDPVHSRAALLAI